MQNLASKRIDHADCMVTHGTDDRVIQPAALDQFTDQDALVDEIDLFAIRHEPAVFVSHFARVGDDAIIALQLKVIVEEDEFAIGGYFLPVEDGNAWALLPPHCL